MKFSYFNQGNNKFGLATIGRAITGFISTVSPRLSGFIGEQLLMRPYGKRHYSDNSIIASEELSLKTSIGEAHINLYGQGQEVIIVSHGWADSSQSFNQMIKSLIKHDVMVAAIDHIGHGKSTGNKSHLPSFIETMTLLIEHFEQQQINVKGIVGHSMGAIATLNLPTSTLEGKKLILISSPIKFFELMFEKVEQVGISRKLLISVLEKITKQYGIVWRQLQCEQQTHKLNLDITFIHDRNDRFAPFDDIEHYLAEQQKPLFATSGLGHSRILGDTKVINHINQIFAN